MKNMKALVTLGTKSDEKINIEGMDLFRAIEEDGLRAELYLDLAEEQNIVRFYGPGYYRTFKLSNEETENIFG